MSGPWHIEIVRRIFQISLVMKTETAFTLRFVVLTGFLASFKNFIISYKVVNSLALTFKVEKKYSNWFKDKLIFDCKVLNGSNEKF